MDELKKSRLGALTAPKAEDVGRYISTHPARNACTLPPFLHSYLSGKSSYNFKAPPTPVATADAANETQANSVKSFIGSVDSEGGIGLLERLVVQY